MSEHHAEYVRVVGGAWEDGKLPAPSPLIHRLSHRESTGLAVVLCGMRQESRSNGWVFYQPDRMGEFPICAACEAALTDGTGVQNG